jgi:hypothetical protein
VKRKNTTFGDGRCFQEDYTHYLILHKGMLSALEINTSLFVGFEVLAATGVTMAVFWVEAPCRLVEV